MPVLAWMNLTGKGLGGVYISYANECKDINLSPLDVDGVPPDMKGSQG